MDNKLRALMTRFGFSDFIEVFEQNSVLTIGDFSSCSYWDFFMMGIDNYSAKKLCKLRDRVNSILRKKDGEVEDKKSSGLPQEAQRKKTNRIAVALIAVVFLLILGIVYLAYIHLT